MTTEITEGSECAVRETRLQHTAHCSAGGEPFESASSPLLGIHPKEIKSLSQKKASEAGETAWLRARAALEEDPVHIPAALLVGL